MRKNALSVKNFKMANMYTVSGVVERLDDLDFDLDDGLDSYFGRGVLSYLSRADLDGFDGVRRGDREMDTPLPLVRFRVIWTPPRVSLHLVEPRYKV